MQTPPSHSPQEYKFQMEEMMCMHDDAVLLRQWKTVSVTAQLCCQLQQVLAVPPVWESQSRESFRYALYSVSLLKLLSLAGQPSFSIPFRRSPSFEMSSWATECMASLLLLDQIRRGRKSRGSSLLLCSPAHCQGVLSMLGHVPLFVSFELGTE